MGRALDVDLQGVNIAFGAGTGVLPFMDLVGYVARHSLGVTSMDESSPGQDFFFWLSVRMSAQEAIGDELLSALTEHSP